MEELNRSSDGTNGSHALAAGFKAKSGGRSGGREGHNGGGRSKRDGKGRPPNQRQPQHPPRHQREQQPAHQPQQQQHQRGISESSSPRISSNISSRSRNSSTRGISRDISRSSPHSIQGGGVHHAFVSGVVNTGIFCRSAVQYPPRVILTRTRARKLRLIHILKTMPILGAALYHHSQPPCRRTCLDRPFRPSHPRASSANRPPWRNLRHQASFTYRVKAW